MNFKITYFFSLLFIMIILNSCQQPETIQKQIVSKEKENRITDSNIAKNFSDEQPTCKFLKTSKEIKLDPAPLNDEFKNNAYSYRINTKWRNFINDVKGSFPGEGYYSLEGRDFPAFFNEGPVIANVWSITETKYKNLETAKKDWVDGIFENKDRDFTDAPEMQTCRGKIKSGEDAYFIKTNFYRKSKGLNYSRYDVLAFKNEKTFTITFTIAYAADFSEAEEALYLDYIAGEILKSLQIY